MTTEPTFSIGRSSITQTVTISFEGEPLRVPVGISVAAALLIHGIEYFRLSAVGQAPRAPYCMMGVCFECLLEIDHHPGRQSCLVPVQDGMQVRRQIGAGEIGIADKP